MTTTTVTYGPDEQEAYELAHHASYAWRALNEIENTVRRQLKHGEPINDRDTLEAVLSIVTDVVWRIQ